MAPCWRSTCHVHALGGGEGASANQGGAQGSGHSSPLGLSYSQLRACFFEDGQRYTFFFSGCRNFTSMDGIWKLRHPICMYPVATTVAGFEALNYPDVCTNAPYSKGSAFCEVHCLTATKREIPTNLGAFLHDYCGV